MNRYRLLVADPNPAVRKLLSVVFADSHYQMVFAADGEEALGLAIVDPPDLVIAETRLERLDGLTLCHQLKQHPRCESTRVLILTTSTADWDVRRAKRVGADGYVTKPFSPSMLLGQVDNLLQGKMIDFGDLHEGDTGRLNCC